jgi:hypothetical protein
VKGSLFNLNVYRGLYTWNITLGIGKYQLSTTLMDTEKRDQETVKISERQLQELREKPGYTSIPRIRWSRDKGLYQGGP